eukprot:3921185-Rhodomonas_salina.1
MHAHASRSASTCAHAHADRDPDPGRHWHWHPGEARPGPGRHWQLEPAEGHWHRAANLQGEHGPVGGIVTLRGVEGGRRSGGHTRGGAARAQLPGHELEGLSASAGPRPGISSSGPGMPGPGSGLPVDGSLALTGRQAGCHVARLSDGMMMEKGFDFG